MVSGKPFRGWYQKNGTTYTKVSDNIDYEALVTGDATYVPDTDWSITYNANGGALASNPATYNVNTETFTLSNPTKANNDFLGWTGSNGTAPQMVVTVPKGSAGDKDYTANWQPYYTVTWNAALAEKTLTYRNDDGYYTARVDYIGTDTSLKGYNVDVSSTGSASYNQNKQGYKRIRYTAPNGTISFADPFVAGSIKIKPGTPIIIEMFSAQAYFGMGGGAYGGYLSISKPDNTNIYVSNISYCYLLNLSYTPQNNVTLTKNGDSYRYMYGYSNSGQETSGPSFRWGIKIN